MKTFTIVGRETKNQIMFTKEEIYYMLLQLEDKNIEKPTLELIPIIGQFDF